MAKYHYLIPLLLEILGNMCIVIICSPIYAVIKFEINLSFLIEPFPILSESHNKNIKYLKNEKSL